jgi:hypothetical protein
MELESAKSTLHEGQQTQHPHRFLFKPILLVLTVTLSAIVNVRIPHPFVRVSPTFFLGRKRSSILNSFARHPKGHAS